VDGAPRQAMPSRTLTPFSHHPRGDPAATTLTVACCSLLADWRGRSHRVTARHRDQNDPTAGCASGPHANNASIVCAQWGLNSGLSRDSRLLQSRTPVTARSWMICHQLGYRAWKNCRGDQSEIFSVFSVERRCTVDMGRLQGVDPYLQPNQIQPNIYVEGNTSRSTELEFNTYLFSRGARLYRQFLLDRPHTPFQEAFSRRSR